MTTSTVNVRVSSSRSEAEPHDVLTRAFHWTTTSLVFLLYGLYIAWERMPKGDVKHLLIVSHLSLGAVLTVVLAGRLIWRSSSLSSRQLHDADLQGLAARLMHLALYILLIAQALLGWNFRWAQGQPMSVFGIFISSHFSYPAGARHTIVVLHYWIGIGIVFLALVHAAAAIFHHFILKDDVLRRMIVSEPDVKSR